MNPPFKFFDPNSSSQITHNRVPHFEQTNATYFVTFRLSDAIPREPLANFILQKNEWMATKPPRPWPIEIENEYHRLFSKRFERWLDRGYGSCVLKNPEIAVILKNTFEYFEGERTLLHAWVVMPNHVHVLFSQLGNHTLSSIMHSWKGFSARQINAYRKHSGTVWQKSYFDRMIRDWNHFTKCARYIRNNPIKAKLSSDQFLHGESDFVSKILGVAPSREP